MASKEADLDLRLILLTPAQGSFSQGSLPASLAETVNDPQVGRDSSSSKP